MACGRAAGGRRGGSGVSSSRACASGDAGRREARRRRCVRRTSVPPVSKTAVPPGYPSHTPAGPAAPVLHQTHRDIGHLDGLLAVVVVHGCVGAHCKQVAGVADCRARWRHRRGAGSGREVGQRRAALLAVFGGPPALHARTAGLERAAAVGGRAGSGVAVGAGDAADTAQPRPRPLRRCPHWRVATQHKVLGRCAAAGEARVDDVYEAAALRQPSPLRQLGPAFDNLQAGGSGGGGRAAAGGTGRRVRAGARRLLAACMPVPLTCELGAGERQVTALRTTLTLRANASDPAAAISAVEAACCSCSHSKPVMAAAPARYGETTVRRWVHMGFSRQRTSPHPRGMSERTGRHQGRATQHSQEPRGRSRWAGPHSCGLRAPEACQKVCTEVRSRDRLRNRGI